MKVNFTIRSVPLMLTEKENLRRVHRREIPEWIPQNFAAVQLFCPSCYQPHGLPFQGGL